MADILTPERNAHSAGAGLSFQLGQKIHNQPLAISSDLLGGLLGAIKDDKFDPAFASRFAGNFDNRSRFTITDDGIAIVPISGVLLDRGNWLGDLGGWATTYEGLAEQFRRLAKDGSVKAVLLNIDSGGGMAAGLPDLTNELAKLKKKKRVYAVANSMALSAAYWIGCAAHEFYVNGIGMAGSIGVISVHMSMQRYLDGMGIDPTIIKAGAQKANGNPYQQLTNTGRAEMSAAVDAIYDKFAAHVAAHRPLQEDAVRATEARVFMGQDAVKAKLANGVKSFEDVLAHIRSAQKTGKPANRRRKTKTGGRQMSTSTDPAEGLTPELIDSIGQAYAAGMAGNNAAQAVPAAQAAPAAPAPAPAASAPAAPAAETQPAASASDPAEAERERINSILSCDAAKDRPALAQKLAFTAGMTAETAADILGAAAVETTTASASSELGNALAAQMAKPGNSAGVKPEASGAGDRPSFSQFCAADADKNRSAH